MSLRKQVITGLGWSAIGRLLSQLLTWSITIIVMRILSPDDYGLKSMAGIFILFLTMFNEFGFGEVLIQDQNMTKIKIRKIFGLLLIINLLFFFLTVGLSPVIAGFFNEQRLSSIIGILALQFLISPFIVIPRALLLRDMKYKQLAIIEFMANTAGGIITLLLALKGMGVWALVWGSITIFLVKSAVTNYLCPYFCMPIFSFKGMRESISFGSYLTIIRIMWFFFRNADTFLVGKLLGKELLGFYSIALQLASMPMEKVSGLINQVAFPAYSSIQGDLKKVASNFLKGFRVMSFLSFPILWGMSSISSELIRIFLGSKWYAAAIPMKLLCLIIPIFMLNSLISPALVGIGRPDILFKNVRLGAISIIPAIYIGTFWGIIGVSLAWVLVYPLVFLHNIWLVHKVLEISFLSILKSIFKPIIAGIGMYSIVLVVKTGIGDGVRPIVNLGLLIGTGALIYTSLIVLINRSGCREVVKLAHF